MSCDVLIVGGGPAGLTAAINAASEGLRVQLLDAGPTLGGQAKESHAIENFPGYPAGITGRKLTASFYDQCVKFGVELHCPAYAVAGAADANGFTVFCADGEAFTGRAAVLALGLGWRKLPAEGVARLLGRGVSYGMAAVPNGCRIVIVGAANSAGQAALRAARDPKSEVTILARRPIADQMSDYLVQRIEAAENIEVRVGGSIAAVLGSARLESLRMDNGDVIPCRHAMIFIGAVPQTQWLRGGPVELDPDGFVLAERHESSVPGVFAVGDCRSGSVKRIATAVGEGAGVVPLVHRWLA